MTAPPVPESMAWYVQVDSGPGQDTSDGHLDAIASRLEDLCLLNPSLHGPVVSANIPNQVIMISMTVEATDGQTAFNLAQAVLGQALPGMPFMQARVRPDDG